MTTLLVIDDNQERLTDLVERVRVEGARFGGVSVYEWLPVERDWQDHLEKLLGRFEPDLVVTDMNLSEGVNGLSGAAIADVASERLIPVARYTAQTRDVHRRPDVFEIQLPRAPSERARLAMAIALGFSGMSKALGKHGATAGPRSPAHALASAMGRPSAELLLGQYVGHVGVGVAQLQAMKAATEADKNQLLTYILGHCLLNVVLPFPGVLVSREALAGYFAVADTEIETIEKAVPKAAYEGPFSTVRAAYWLEDLDDWCASTGADQADDAGVEHRQALEKSLGRPFARHKCERGGCGGLLGGFFCPFSQRPVCLRDDCSVSSDSWVPVGARLSRIDRDFYEEWKPFLGR